MKHFFPLNLDLTRVQGNPQVHWSWGYIQRNLACYITIIYLGEESEWGKGGGGANYGLQPMPCSFTRQPSTPGRPGGRRWPARSSQRHQRVWHPWHPGQRDPLPLPPWRHTPPGDTYPRRSAVGCGGHWAPREGQHLHPVQAAGTSSPSTHSCRWKGGGVEQGGRRYWRHG